MKRLEMIIDTLGDETVTVEQEGRMLWIPRALLPADAREGDVLSVELRIGAGESEVRFVRDEAATERARRDAADALARLIE